MKKFISVFLVIVSLPCSSIVRAEEDVWGILAKRSDTTITVEKNAGGKSRRVAKLTSGVEFRESAHGITATDNSGAGAVMCTWMIYSETLNLLNTCFKNSHDNYKKAYGAAVNRISDFIVANNLTPITRSELEESNRKIFSEGHKGESLDKICASDLMPAKDKDMDEARLKGFQVQIDKLLSIPRPPVMNPCI